MLRKQPWYAAAEMVLRRPFLSSVIIHRERYTQGPAGRVAVRLLCRKSAFSRPSNLSIVLVHDRTDETIMERSLRYSGIHDFTLLRADLPRGVWRNSLKIRAMLEFARSARTDFILYSDSFDAVLAGDPAGAIDQLKKSNAKILFSTTGYRNYRHMPEMEDWFDRQAAKQGFPQCKTAHLNSGVYIAERRFLLKFLSEAAQYVTDNDIPVRELRNMQHKLPGFPRGCGSDQNIFRFIYPRYKGELALDYAGRLAMR